MRRTDRIVIRDAACQALLATRITYPTEARRAAAAASHVYKLADVPGLVRYAMYRGLDDLTLVELSQWSNRASRHEHAHRVHASTPGHADWRHVCDEPYRTFVGATDEPATCLVIDRQPLRRADISVAGEWIDAIIAALDSQAPNGLCAATFFVSTGRDVVLSFAEWTNAEAHCRATHKADFQRSESIDDSEERGGAPTHPGITAQREVGRYALVANLEAELIADGATRRTSAG